MSTITGKENIEHFRRFTLLKALKLETMGMKGRGASAYSIIKREYGLKGNKQKVYEQFKQYVEDNKPEVK